jgi:hypothetical protein
MVRRLLSADLIGLLLGEDLEDSESRAELLKESCKPCLAKRIANGTARFLMSSIRAPPDFFLDEDLDLDLEEEALEEDFNEDLEEDLLGAAFFAAGAFLGAAAFFTAFLVDFLARRAPADMAASADAFAEAFVATFAFATTLARREALAFATPELATTF